METCPLEFGTPDFGSSEEVRRLTAPVTPRSLFRALLSPDDHAAAFEPAYRFVSSALQRAAAGASQLLGAGDAQSFVAGLIAWAQPELQSGPPERSVSTWPLRVAHELAPFGLTDGAWLHGAARANVVESRVGMLLLKQLMLRFGDPGTRESYAERYAILLRSIGFVPASITRWERDEAAPCSDISYEYALLGLALGLFPSAFLPETVGFNLWASSFGPCRLLNHLKDRLGPGACTRYLDTYDAAALRELAIQAAVELLAWSPDPGLRARLVSGFVAAHRSQVRWERAMRGGTIPLLPQEAVLDMIKRKALFAADHHAAVSLDGENLGELLSGGEESHRAILRHLAGSPLITPGRPEESLLVTHSLSVNGPMFEAFTASEITELKEWIVSLALDAPPQRPGERLAPEGEYHPLQDAGSLARYGASRFSGMPPHELLFHFANADRYPAVRPYARQYAESVLDRIDAVLFSHPCFAAERAPAYSEEALAELVARHHEKNLGWRHQAPEALEVEWQKMRTTEPMLLPLDGCWLQGFVDVYRSGLEEYGWLFRIYASEQGDGNIDWNHNRIYRLCFAPEDIKARGQTTAKELFAAYREHFLGGVLLKLAMSLHTSFFLPELLGLNLANEASGVGGTYLYFAQRFGETAEPYRALDFSLHNCIDNYASGHTKWSLSAVQAFMARVLAVSPAAAQGQWQRIWRFLRLGQVFDHGTDSEKRALAGLWFPPASDVPARAPYGTGPDNRPEIAGHSH